MNLKVSKKIKNLALKQEEIMKTDNCDKVKGGYGCCIRNKRRRWRNW